MDGAGRSDALAAGGVSPAPSCAVSALDEEALSLWRAHEAQFSGTAYQSCAFVSAYLEGLSPQRKAQARLVICRDASNKVILLLPVIIQRLGPWRIAGPIGGAHANYSLPLFDAAACAGFLPQKIAASVTEALLAAGCDLLLLPHAPAAWQGHANPLIAASHRPSVNGARHATLQADTAASLRSLRSKDSLRRLAAKKKKLAAHGALAAARAMTTAEKSTLIDAYKALKDKWSQQRGIRNEFQDRLTAGFYQRLAGLEDFLMWSLKLDGEVIGVCGGFRRAGHLSLTIISSEQERYARFTPGDILIEAAISDLCELHVRSIDFGTGEAEYKRRWLSHELALIDIVHPVTLAGQMAGVFVNAMLACKGFIKSHPNLLKLAHRARWRSTRPQGAH